MPRCKIGVESNALPTKILLCIQAQWCCKYSLTKIFACNNTFNSIDGRVSRPVRLHAMTCFKYFIAFHPFIKNYKYTTKSDHERFSKVLFDYFELVKKWNQNFSPRFSTSFQRVLTRSRTDWRIPVTSSASAWPSKSEKKGIGIRFRQVCTSGQRAVTNCSQKIWAL